MLRRIARSSLAVSLILSASSIPAQSQAASAATGQGTVTGHVILSDSNAPARFAHVLLKRIPDGPAEKPKAEDPESMLAALLGQSSDKPDKPEKGGKATPPKPQDAETKAAGAAFATVMSSVGDMVSSTTVGATGEYTLTNVKPGSYYVHAVLPGYIDPLAAFSAQEINGVDPAAQQRIRGAVAVITINNHETARLDLRMELGAAISGRVLYEDGSPAAGWKLAAHPVQKSKPAGGSPFDGLGLGEGDIPSMTDMLFQESHTANDRGEYRLAGLAPGDYIVQATLTSGNATAGSAMAGGSMRLTVFSGNVVREQEAKPVTVTVHEDRKGEDLVMRLSALHSISGKVLAKTDSQAANSGNVVLHDDQETSVLKAQTATIQPDGSFRFDYVPNGSYTLKVRNGAVTEATGGSKKMFGIEIPNTKKLRAFGTVEQKIEVADSDRASILLTLPDAPLPKEKD